MEDDYEEFMLRQEAILSHARDDDGDSRVSRPEPTTERSRDDQKKVIYLDNQSVSSKSIAGVDSKPISNGNTKDTTKKPPIDKPKTNLFSKPKAKAEEAKLPSTATSVAKPPGTPNQPAQKQPQGAGKKADPKTVGNKTPTATTVKTPPQKPPVCYFDLDCKN